MLPPLLLLITACWQGFAPWPAERLDEIGGGRAAYIADGVTRREQGEARRRRALEAFGSWCPQVDGCGWAAWACVDAAAWSRAMLMQWP